MEVKLREEMVLGSTHICETTGEGQSYTRGKKRHLHTKIPQSALADHAGQKDYITNWEGVRLPAKELNYKKKGI